MNYLRAVDSPAGFSAYQYFDHPNWDFFNVNKRFP